MSSHASAGRPPASKKRGRDAATDEFSDLRRAMQAVDTTFITIHDLTYNANILYASTSITDVLEYRPDEVIGRSCWEYFHPEEIPFAKAIHGRGIELDKASVLNYCRIKNKLGEYVGCECVFTVVYNVLIGCTSVYLDGPKAKKRAIEAPVVRQLFSSSPRDPRYHMLQYISSKFASGPRPHLHEPRAALFLNRFTRTLTINFATNGLESLLGLSASDLKNQSFYYCIRQNCLAEAIRCLESAKANDSIAYLRFWFRDPRGDGFAQHEEIIDQADGSSSDDDDGGVQIAPRIHVDGSPPEQAIVSSDSSGPPSANGRLAGEQNLAPQDGDDSRHFSSGSGHSTDMGQDGSNAMFDRSPDHRPSTPRSAMSLDSPELRTPPRQPGQEQGPRRSPRQQAQQVRPRHDVELEAVVSCTSDGLVVIMRAARPFVPDSVRAPPQRAISPYSNGLFASPWASTPIMPDPSRFPSYIPPVTTQSYAPTHIASMGTHPAFMPPHPQPPSIAKVPASATGPSLVDFMNSIRDVAVFAWALTGINGSLQQYGRGVPLMGSVPHAGLPVWDPDGGLAAKEKEQAAAAAVELRGTDKDTVTTSCDPGVAETIGQNQLAEGESIANGIQNGDDTSHPAKPDVSVVSPLLNGSDASGSQAVTGNNVPPVKEAEVNGDHDAAQ